MSVRAVRILSTALALGAQGCGDARITEPARGGTSPIKVVVPSGNTVLVGKWSFTRFFTDDSGDFQSSQTVWDFGYTGNVTRTVYADNLTDGIGDAVVTTGKWTSSATVITVTFDGSSIATNYDYHFEGTALVLAGIAFVRLPR